MTVEYATFGAGCFWCLEAIFSSLKGVYKVSPGYSGGYVENPSYEQVCTDTTGHAEVCYIEFNPEQISFIQLLEVFWKVHNPTILNKQGEDIGSQYRSVIFCHNAIQEESAKKILNELIKASVWEQPIITQIEAFTNFYSAEEYHKDYFRNNPNQQYCSRVVKPKVDKFKDVFREYLK